jgi:hypothetical protein
MRLLRRAAEEAVRRELPELTQELLREAFTATLAGKRRNIANPFTASLPETVETPENEYWPVRRQRSG